MAVARHGSGGQLNQCASQIIFPFVYEGSASEARAQLGIYGACIQDSHDYGDDNAEAFRYAYEPFVFGRAKDKDNKDTYAKAMASTMSSSRCWLSSA